MYMKKKYAVKNCNGKRHTRQLTAEKCRHARCEWRH